MEKRIEAALNRAERIADKEGVPLSDVRLYLDTELAKAMMTLNLVSVAPVPQTDPYHLICQVVAR